MVLLAEIWSILASLASGKNQSVADLAPWLVPVETRLELALKKRQQSGSEIVKMMQRKAAGNGNGG